MDTNQIVILEKASVNLMNRQAMILFRNHDYKASQPKNYTSYIFITLGKKTIFI